jgi:hypothetical protein
MKMKQLMNRSLFLMAFTSLSVFAETEEPESGFEINGYSMASFEYFNYGADGRQNIEFGWNAGKSDGARECARKSQIALKAALENLTKDGVDQLGLKEYGFSSIYLITSDFDQVSRTVRDGQAWAWGQDEDTQKNGLIKFHGFYKNGVCKHPTEQDLKNFAQAQIAKIKRLEAQAAARAAAARTAPPVQDEGGQEAPVSPPHSEAAE